MDMTAPQHLGHKGGDVGTHLKDVLQDVGAIIEGVSRNRSLSIACSAIVVSDRREYQISDFYTLERNDRWWHT